MTLPLPSGRIARHVLLRKATGHEEELDLFVVNDGGDKLPGCPVNDPELIAGIGIIARHGKAPGKNHLGPPVDFPDGGGAIASLFVRAICFPDLLSGLLIEGDEVGVSIVVAIDDHLFVPENGAGAVAVLAGEGAGAGFPEFVPFEIEGGDEHVFPSRKLTKISFPFVTGVLEARKLSR